MGFTNQERINLFTKSLLANVLDANAIAQWYETKFPFKFALDGNSVWTQLSSIPTASSLAVARTNATNNPTLIQDLSQNASAIRLTKIAGTNDSTYVAYLTYNDVSSDILDNWLMPQMVLQANGNASIGYAVNLYDGDPNAGGSLVTTTAGTTGTGVNKSVGWIYNYSNGMLLLSDDFKANVSDPYIVGFRYIGKTAASESDVIALELVADETIAIGDILRLVVNGEGLTAGRVIKALPTSSVTADCIGVALSAGNQGDNVKIAISGKTAVKFGSNPPTTDRGKSLYLSSVAGQATTTIPTNNAVVKIGNILDSNGSSSTPNCLISINFEIFLG
jgi:hypothetical protein